MPDETNTNPNEAATGAESKEDQSEKKASAKRSKKRKWWIIGFTALVLVLGALYAVYYFTVGQYYLNTDDAYVRGNQVQLMSQVSGTVTSIDAEETDLVKQGQPVVELDTTDFRVAFQQAETNLASTVRQVQSLFEKAQQQQARVRLKQAQLKLAQKNYHRDKNLISKDVIPQRRFDNTSTNLDAAQAGVALAQHQLSGTQAQISKTTVENHPQVRLAEDRLRKAYLALKRTQILAPATGYVARRTVQVGQEVNPGLALMAIVPLKQVWVDANFKETSLASVRVGQPVNLTADLYGGGVTYHGRVTGLAAGTGAAFELLPPQNATGNWIKVVQRLPVRVEIPAQELRRHPLHLGLSMTATINIHHQSGPRLAKRPGPKAGYQTNAFKNRLRGVQTIINKIVRDNIVTKLAGDMPAQARNAKSQSQ